MKKIVAIDLDKTLIKIDSVRLFILLNIFNIKVFKLIIKKIFFNVGKNEFHFEISEIIEQSTVNKSKIFIKIINLFLDYELLSYIQKYFPNEKKVIISNSPQVIVDIFMINKIFDYGFGLNPYSESNKDSRSLIKINTLNKNLHTSEYDYFLFISDNIDDKMIFKNFKYSFYWQQNIEELKKYLDKI